MKRILISIYAYYPFENANTNVLLPVIAKLKTRYQVDIMACDQNGKNPAHEIVDGVNIYRYRRASWIKDKIGRLENVDGEKNRSFGKSVFVKLAKPLAEFLARFIRFPDFALINKLIDMNNYDLIISVSAPIDPSYTMLKVAESGLLARKNIKWISYFMDPHADYIGNRSNSLFLFKKEMEIYRKSYAVIMTPEMLESNKQNQLGKYIGKSIPMPLCNLKIIKSNTKFSTFDNTRVNCLYVGSLQDLRVRDPEYFYKIIQHCNDGIIFHIIANYVNRENRILKNKYLDNRSNVIWYDRLPLSACYEAMSTADILINLGNKCTNQTPSKVFDYIGTGKPIINIQAIANDTAAKYLDRYEPVLKILDRGEIDLNDVRNFMDFCVRYKGVSNDVDKIMNDYHELSADNVAEQFCGFLSYALDDHNPEYDHADTVT